LPDYDAEIVGWNLIVRSNVENGSIVSTHFPSAELNFDRKSFKLVPGLDPVATFTALSMTFPIELMFAFYV
jgi:hypothetical protein